MIKAIGNKITFGMGQEVSNNEMSKEAIEKRKAVKNLTLMAEKLDCFDRNRKEADCQKFEMKMLSNLVIQLKHAEQSIIDVLKNRDNAIRLKHDIKEGGNKYNCAINAEIHESLKSLDDLEAS